MLYTEEIFENDVNNTTSTPGRNGDVEGSKKIIKLHSASKQHDAVSEDGNGTKFASKKSNKKSNSSVRWLG